MAWRRGRGGGWGGSWGRGRGWGRGFYAAGRAYGAPYGYAPYGAPSTEEEVAYLRNQAEWLRDTLEAITNRIEELEREED
jgi:hypothetical protein